MFKVDVAKNRFSRFLLLAKESTLFVVLTLAVGKSRRNRYSDNYKFMVMIEESVHEQLALIPYTKLLISHDVYGLTFRGALAKMEEFPRETLQVRSSTRIALATMLHLLKKRSQTLDLISVMLELKRTLRLKRTSYEQEERVTVWSHGERPVEIFENLSCLPKLQKTEQNSEINDLKHEV